MKIKTGHNYYTYITTNKNKTVLYIGVTNNLTERISQHRADAETNSKSFAARYNCYNLIYWEYFTDINMAIARETELKGWTRTRKEELINSFNPDWKFLTEDNMHP